jgi:Zn-dependent protease
MNAEELRALAAEAEAAERDGDPGRALAAWQSALALLPAGSQQHATITERIGALGPAPTPAAPKPARPAWASGAGVLGTLALLLWKFKFVVVFLLSKAKLLLLGFTKMGTLLSMFAAMGVYWTMWGWKFALGFVLSIYVHEMGHVMSLRRYGVPATAPMFIPGLGAFIRLKEKPATPGIEARTGLAGPVYGLGAALAALAGWWITGAPVWKAIAVSGAVLNLFNLLPIWQLDGGHAFQGMNRPLRWMAVAAVAFALFATGQSWLIFIVAAAIYQAFQKPAVEKPDWEVLWLYAFLVLTLAYLAIQPVPVGARV